MAKQHNVRVVTEAYGEQLFLEFSVVMTVYLKDGCAFMMALQSTFSIV